MSASFAAEIDGASCVSPSLNEKGMRYVVEIGEAVFGPKGEFYTAVNKYYSFSERYPEVSYNGNSRLSFDLREGKIEARFIDRADPEKFSLKIVSGLTFGVNGEVALAKNFQAKVNFGYRPESEAILVNCIH